MVRCSYCGVELEENANFCSLCGEPVWSQEADKLNYIKSRKREQEQKFLTDYQKLTGFQKRMVFWQISGMILVAGGLITFIIDLVANQGITWSRYPVTVTLVLFINTTLISFWLRRVILLLTFSFMATSILLVLLDIYAGNTGWGMQLGIPLLLAGYVGIYIFIMMVRNSDQRGLNIIAYSLVISGLLCLCIDGILSLYSGTSLHFRWSLIVMASVAIISPILLYVHYRLKKVTDLKRFFHI
jgi:hypothetical protein